MGELQKKSFEHVLGKIEKRLTSVHWGFERTHKRYLQHDMPGAYRAAFELAAAAEKLVLLTRDLPAHTGNPKAPFDLNAMLLETVDVDIGYTKEGWFSLRMPMLLPKKHSGSADYVRTLLYVHLHRFFLERPPDYLDECVIVFRHVYDKERPERQYRDHDNIELNMVVDVVAMYTMKDDTPMRCSHYYCSGIGSGDRTEVYVLPRTDFMDWICAENAYGESPVELYAAPPETGSKQG